MFLPIAGMIISLLIIAIGFYSVGYTNGKSDERERGNSERD